MSKPKYGLQTFDEKGALLFDSDERILKLQGIKQIVTAGGYQDIKLHPRQEPFAIILPDQDFEIGNGLVNFIIRMSEDGSSARVIWRQKDVQGSKVQWNHILYYGAY